MMLQKKEVPKKAYEDRGAAHDEESPLDDPVAEKLRQQRSAAEQPCDDGLIDMW